MKYFSAIILLNFLFACSEKRETFQAVIARQEQSREEQKREYFNDSIAIFRIGPVDSSNEFSYFFRKHYPDTKTKYADPFIYAFEEPLIDTTKIDTTTKWFRLTVEPCFRLPYCLVIEQKKGKTFLTTKVTDGDGGHNTGTLVINIKLPIQDSVYDNIASDLHSLDFWTLGYDTTCRGGLDGESWIFECIDRGRYNRVSRWYPQGCGNKITNQLARIGLRLRKRSRLEKLLSVFGEKIDF